MKKHTIFGMVGVCAIAALMISFVAGPTGSMLTIAESSPEAPLAANSYIEHDPISLIGDDQVDSFFAGNGTDGLSWESAHRLENLNISNFAGKFGIDIENSTRYILIKNFYSSHTGNFYAVNLKNCSNIDINGFYIIQVENQIDEDYGIHLDGVSNIIIRNGELNNFTGGIISAEVPIKPNDGVNISNVDITECYVGIYLEYGQNIEIINSYVDVSYVAIMLGMECENIFIINNTIYGEYFIDDYPSKNYAEIIFNTINVDKILLSHINNTVFHHNLFNSSLFEIRNSVYNTKIYNNDFISPNEESQEIRTFSEDVLWFDDISERGNYWYNYTTQNPGASNNGIYWTTPYEVIYDSGIFDNYPLVSELSRKALNAQFSHSGDFSYGGEGIITIIPEGEDYFGFEYTLSLDPQTLLQTGTWNSGDDNLMVSIADLDIGDYTLVVELDNPMFGESIQKTYDFIITTPLPSAPILITESGTLTASTTTLEWEPVDYATNYTIYINGVQIVTVSDVMAEMTFLMNGTYYITITANNEQGSSEVSEAVILEVAFSLIINGDRDNGDDNNGGGDESEVENGGIDSYLGSSLIISAILTISLLYHVKIRGKQK